MGQRKLTYKQAAEYFRLDEAAGGLVWNCRRHGVQFGMPAGFMLNGCKYVTVDWERLQVKKIVWLLATGEWPQRHLYYADGNPENCSYGNLTTRRIKQGGGKPEPFITVEKLPDGQLVVKNRGQTFAANREPIQILAAVAKLLEN